jgi:hypothetical protein
MVPLESLSQMNTNIFGILTLVTKVDLRPQRVEPFSGKIYFLNFSKNPSGLRDSFVVE